MSKEISNSDDIINSRDVIERLEELQAERETLTDAILEAENALSDAEEALADLQEELDETAESDDREDAAKEAVEDAEEALKDANADLAAWDKDNGQELAILTALDEEGGGYAADWRHGETLIRDSYFEDYAQELAKDIGAVSGDESWPLDHINWQSAAEALKMDYSAIDFGGVTYWTR